MYQYYVTLKDGTEVKVVGWSIRDARKFAKEHFGNKYVSIAYHSRKQED